jgi:hypothetical protein
MHISPHVVGFGASTRDKQVGRGVVFEAQREGRVTIPSVAPTNRISCILMHVRCCDRAVHLESVEEQHTLLNRLDANMLDCAERLQVPILCVVRRTSPEWCDRVRVVSQALAPLRGFVT